MSHIIAIHSFRRGTGKTMVIANFAAVLAQAGKRVAVIDTGFRSPSLHILFGYKNGEMAYTLNDVIHGRCAIEQTAYDLSAHLGIDEGTLYLVPASTDVIEISHMARQGYDVNALNEGLRDLSKKLDLDVLMLDTQAGINEETMLSMALCDVLGMLVRVDKQDHQGTAVLVSLAKKLGVEDIKLILNDVPHTFDMADLVEETYQQYNCEVAAAFPHSEDMMLLSSGGVFVLEQPEHPMSELLRRAAFQFMA